VVPTSFQNLRALRSINIAAVGLALTSVVAPLLSIVSHEVGDIGAVGGLPTLICGLLWAWLLRSPQTVGQSSIRWGWVASIPLAMLNAGLTVALLMAISISASLDKFFLAVVFGGIFGAIVWVPALLATLVCFGVPIASAQRLAKKGLAGEERGEWIVGLTCFVMSAVGLVVSFGMERSLGVDGGVVGVIEIWVPRMFALLGLLAGATSTGLARAREARRRTFVADAEAGKIPGYRIEPTEEGKVLMRIVSQGNGYRVADFEEEVFELDAEGEAMRPKHVEDVSTG
jgi:hypothetical protein